MLQSSKYGTFHKEKYILEGQLNLQEQKRIIEEIKFILKQQKITYGTLSKKSSIPLSSLKKIFAGGDCSFSKIINIVNALDLDFFQLVDNILKKKEEVFFSFTLNQEEFFSKNLIYYLFFHKVFRDKLTPLEAMKVFNLPEKKLWSILRKLEEFSLLEITNFPNIKMKVQGGINFISDGPLQKKLMEDVMNSFCHFLQFGRSQKKPVDSPFVRLYFSKVSKETFNYFLKELNNLHTDFASMAVRDRRYLDTSELIDCTWLFGLGHCHGIDLAYHQEIK